MEKEVKEFLILNGAILVMLVLYLLRRRPRSYLKLKLKEGNSKDNSREISGDLAKGLEVTSSGQSPTPSEVPRSKTLNVIFNYNGHSWDAFEVLGLPAGSSREQVEVSYRQSLEMVDKESQVFVETAYRAILTHWQTN